MQTDFVLARKNQHPQIGTGNLQPRPWMDGSAPWEEGANTDENLKTVYEANSSLILRRHQVGNVCSIYTIFRSIIISSFRKLCKLQTKYTTDKIEHFV